jgi:drug/metabolite transporter (DMT)-like permease
MAPNDGRIATGDWALLGLLSVLWGGSFCFNGVVLKELPPLTVVFVRVVLASLMLLPLLRYKGLSFPSDLSGWTPFVAMALFNNVLPFGLILTAQTQITGGLASILIATTPLFTVLIMAAAGEESLSARRIAGVSLGLIGVMILRANDFGLHDGHAVGILLCLAAAFSYGISALLGRRTLSASPPLATATFQMLVSSVMLAILSLSLEQPWRLPMPSATTVLAIVGLAALSTALAYLVFFMVLQRAGATNVVLVTLMVPITAMLLGYWILGERITRQEIFGALVIGSALVVMDGRVFDLFRRRQPARPSE